MPGEGREEILIGRLGTPHVSFLAIGAPFARRALRRECLGGGILQDSTAISDRAKRLQATHTSADGRIEQLKNANMWDEGGVPMRALLVRVWGCAKTQHLHHAPCKISCHSRGRP